jgi:hypothetical protein
VVAGSPEMGGGCVSGDAVADRPSVGVGRGRGQATLMIKITTPKFLLFFYNLNYNLLFC